MSPDARQVVASAAGPLNVQMEQGVCRTRT